jgi:hypothetical protein
MSDFSWLNLSDRSGTGDKTVTATVTAQGKFGVERQAKVIVQAGVHEEEVVITQLASMLSVTVEAGSGGMVSPTSATRGCGTVLQLTATPGEDYRFLNWYGKTINGNYTPISGAQAVYNATVGANEYEFYRATFEQVYFYITASADPTAGGSVTGTGRFGKNTNTTLVAVPNAGYVFSEWSDGEITASRAVNNITADASFVARFVTSGVTFTPTSLVLPSESSAGYIQVTGVSLEDVSITDAPSWVSGTQVLDEQGFVVITAEANVTGTERSGNITIDYGTGSVAYLVTQLAAVGTLSVASGSMVFSAAGVADDGDPDIRITTNVSWGLLLDD